MNPRLLILPAAALVLSGVWLASQKSAISAVRSEADALRNQLSRTDFPAESLTGEDAAPIEWSKIAFKVQQAGHNDTGLNTLETLRLRKRLNAMSTGELLAALNELEALGLDSRTRSSIEHYIVLPLIRKDPQLALKRLIDRVGESGYPNTWALANGLAEWAAADLPAATAWFDEQIAEGKLQCKSLSERDSARLVFESSFIGTLLATDPAAAALRLTSLPAEHRQHVIESTSYHLQPAAYVSYASAVRSHIEKGKQMENISRPAENIVTRSGFQGVEEYLDQISATPEERSASVTRAAVRKLSDSRQTGIPQLDEFRKWSNSQSPESTDQATGQVLAAIIGGRNTFADAFALAIHYHETTGNDDVLVGFLEGWHPRQHKEESRQLAEKIGDPARREAVLETLR